MAIKSLEESSGAFASASGESLFEASVRTAVLRSTQQQDKGDTPYRVATDNEVWPDVIGTAVQPAPASEGPDALRYTTDNGQDVVVKRAVNPRLHDYLSRLSDLNESSASLQFIELQQRLHDARVLRRDESAPKLSEVLDVERHQANDDVLLVLMKDGTNLVATRELTPEVFETLKAMSHTLDGIEASKRDGYKLVNENSFTNEDIEGALIGPEDEVGPGLIRAEVFDDRGERRKIIVAEALNAELYDRIVTVDEHRRYDSKTLDESRAAADLPKVSDLDLLAKETRVTDPNDGKRKLTVGELTWQNLIADWKKGIEDGSIKAGDDRAKLYDVLRAQAASESGLDMVVLDMSMGQSTTRVTSEDLSPILDRVKLDLRTTELLGSESVQKDLQAHQRKALDELSGKDEMLEQIEKMAFGADYVQYIAKLKENGQHGLAEADIARTYASLAAFDMQKAAQFAQSMMIDANAIDLDRLIANPAEINDENVALATQDTLKTLLAALKKGGIDIPRRTLETERFVQEFLGNKQTAKAFGEALRELGHTFRKKGAVTAADIDKVMGKDIYKTISEGAQGSMLKTLSELNANGVLGSTGGLISLASGIYQLAGKGGSLADTPEERLAIAKDMVSVLGAGQHFVNLGTNIIDHINGTQLNQMMGLDKSLPQIFGKDRQAGGARSFSIIEGDLKKLYEDFNAAIDAAPIADRAKLGEKLNMSDENLKKVVTGFNEGYAKNPGLKGSSPGTRAVSAFLRVMDAGANTFTGVADVVLGGLKIKSGVNSGDDSVIAQGAITVASGAFTLAGGGAQIAALVGSNVARALAGPLLWLGAGLTVALTPFLIVEDIKHNKRMDKHRDDIEQLFERLDRDEVLAADGLRRFEFLNAYMYNYGQRDAPDDVSIFDYRGEEYEFYAGEGHLPQPYFDDVEHHDYGGDGANLDTRLA